MLSTIITNLLLYARPRNVHVPNVQLGAICYLILSGHHKSLEGSGRRIPALFDADLDTKHGTMCMTRNSYCCDVNDIPIELQEEFLDLQNDSSAKDIFKESELHDFWVQMTRVYSK